MTFKKKFIYNNLSQFCFRCTGFLNGRYGRARESYLRDLGVRGDGSKLHITKNDIQVHAKIKAFLFTVN